MTTRRAALALALLVVLSITTASAATLSTDQKTLGAGAGTVGSCDSSFTIAYALGANNTVTQVTVGDIATGCVGGEIRLTLTKNGAAAWTSNHQQVTGATATFATSLAHDAADGYHVAIVGP